MDSLRVGIRKWLSVACLNLQRCLNREESWPIMNWVGLDCFLHDVLPCGSAFVACPCLCEPVTGVEK